MKLIKEISLPQICDPRGNLTFVQFPDQLPFEIKRVFWTYDVPSGAKRGGHAYKSQQEVIIALSGSFDIVISFHDGTHQLVSLNRPNSGLYLPPKVWRRLENFSANSFALHLSSSLFDESDYIRDFEDYRKLFVTG